MLPDYVRLADVCAHMGVSEATVRQWVRLGKIPEPRRVTYHLRVWDRAELMPHLDRLRDPNPTGSVP